MCWAKKPHKRPTAEEIVDTLDGLLQGIPQLMSPYAIHSDDSLVSYSESVTFDTFLSNTSVFSLDHLDLDQVGIFSTAGPDSISGALHCCKSPGCSRL
jgi:hypothetical protein